MSEWIRYMVRHVLSDSRWYHNYMVKVFSCTWHRFHQLTSSTYEFFFLYARKHLKLIVYIHYTLDVYRFFLSFLNTHFTFVHYMRMGHVSGLATYQRWFYDIFHVHLVYTPIAIRTQFGQFSCIEKRNYWSDATLNI